MAVCSVGTRGKQIIVFRGRSLTNSVLCYVHHNWRDALPMSLMRRCNISAMHSTTAAISPTVGAPTTRQHRLTTANGEGLRPCRSTNRLYSKVGTIVPTCFLSNSLAHI